MGETDPRPLQSHPTGREVGMKKRRNRLWLELLEDRLTPSGDMLLNNQQIFVSSCGQYDLYTIALHEAGHSFGLPDNKDQDSILYQTYLGARTGLAPEDIAALQTIYGPRQQDQYALLYNNHSFASAMTMPSQLALQADITTIGDAEYFKVTTPGSLLPNSMQIQVNAGGVSLLEPSLSVYDSSFRLVGTAAASSPLNNNLDRKSVV